jgi:hypothetical protein
MKEIKDKIQFNDVRVARDNKGSTLVILEKQA